MRRNRFRATRTALAVVAMLSGSLSFISCHVRARQSLNLALTGYIYSLLDPANVADLFLDEDSASED